MSSLALRNLFVLQGNLDRVAAILKLQYLERSRIRCLYGNSVLFHFLFSFLRAGRVSPPVGVWCLVVAVVVDDQEAIPVLHKPIPLIIAELLGGIGKGHILEGVAARHESADDVSAVSGCEGHDACDFYHFLFSFLFWVFRSLDCVYIIHPMSAKVNMQNARTFRKFSGRYAQKSP